jgi:hypothetical protein
MWPKEIQELAHRLCIRRLDGSRALATNANPQEEENACEHMSENGSTIEELRRRCCQYY